MNHTTAITISGYPLKLSGYLTCSLLLMTIRTRIKSLNAKVCRDTINIVTSSQASGHRNSWCSCPNGSINIIVRFNEYHADWWYLR